MDSYDNQIQTALKNVENKTEAAPEITLTTGVVLRLKKFSFMRIQSIVSQFKEPEIPKEWDVAREREIRNPDSPVYLAEKAEMDQRRTMAVIDAIMVFGTEIISVPKDFPKLEDDNWIEELEFINIKVDKESRLARYLNWVKNVAIRDPEDLIKISEEFGVQMGTAERRITDKLRENFPHNANGTGTERVSA